MFWCLLMTRSPQFSLAFALIVGVLLPPGRGPACAIGGDGLCQDRVQQESASPAPDEPDQLAEQDRLRGSITPERQWWDVLHYHLQIRVFPDKKRIQGTNTIRFLTLQPGSTMQIDLQPPLEITQVLHAGRELGYARQGNVYWIEFPAELEAGREAEVQVTYAGTPVESRRPPWSGGITWSRDDNDNHFIATTCQGIGASIWWPCKDHGYDEPDRGMQISVTVPHDLVAVSNGRLTATDEHPDQQLKTYHWQVTNPINNYGVNVNIGDYVSFSETYDGAGGKLDMQYWVLSYDRDRAETQFKEAPRTLQAFEYWFGQYPFYEDGYKLVQVPYLGMEHQSSVTYGNGFQNGYRGRDLSATGVGLLFDFIIVHESGHEWFGNNISMRDSADMWIHEGFTNYSENLFVEYHFDQQQAQDYVLGCRRLVRNDRPIIAAYDVNERGSGDMYYKAGNMLHSIRHIIDDDDKWRRILRGLNREFWHQTVTTRQVENYISQQAGIDFSKYFDQFLRSTRIPEFHYQISEQQLIYWYDNVVDGFAYPLQVQVNGQTLRIQPRQDKQTRHLPDPITSFEVDRNFYVEAIGRTGESKRTRSDE